MFLYNKCIYLYKSILSFNAKKVHEDEGEKEPQSELPKKVHYWLINK